METPKDEVKHRKVILVDLDGVLNNYGSRPFNPMKIPGIKQGARSFLRKLNKNYDVVLFTTRGLLLSSKWVIKYNLDKYIKDVTNIKIPAYLYIDDRTVQFKGNYKETLKEIDEFSVYWKKDKLKK